MNNIIIELCAEDRARLDGLNSLLEAHATLTAKLVDLIGERVPAPVHLDSSSAQVPDELTAKLQAIVDRAKNATEEPKEITPPVTPETEEAPTATEEPQPDPAEPVKPSVTLAQIQQKVVQLAAGFDGAKKAAIRGIINAYAKKVSDLPEDKWDEVMQKLTALEKED